MCECEFVMATRLVDEDWDDISLLYIEIFFYIILKLAVQAVCVRECVCV